jgi:hypothetical protein
VGTNGCPQGDRVRADRARPVAREGEAGETPGSTAGTGGPPGTGGCCSAATAVAESWLSTAGTRPTRSACLQPSTPGPGAECADAGAASVSSTRGNWPRLCRHPDLRWHWSHPAHGDGPAAAQVAVGRHRLGVIRFHGPFRTWCGSSLGVSPAGRPGRPGTWRSPAWAHASVVPTVARSSPGGRAACCGGHGAARPP